MAKFDYEKFMREEAKQDRIQEELEDKLHEGDWEAERNWMAWQEKQKSESFFDDDPYSPYPEDYDDDPYLYDEDYGYYDDDPYWDEEDYGYYDDDNPDDYLYPPVYGEIQTMEDVMELLDDITVTPECKEYQPDECETECMISSLTAEDMYDMYWLQDMLNSEGHCSLEDDEIDPCEEDLISEMGLFEEDTVQEEFIAKKAVARNRHLNELKAKKRAKQCANILERRYQTSTVGTDYEEFRLYSRKAAAVKKVSRVKTA